VAFILSINLAFVNWNLPYHAHTSLQLRMQFVLDILQCRHRHPLILPISLGGPGVCGSTSHWGISDCKRLESYRPLLIRVASCRISDSDKQHWRGRRSRQASIRRRCVPCLLNKVDRQRPPISSAVLHDRSGLILSCLYGREPVDCIVKSGFKCESRKTSDVL